MTGLWTEPETLVELIQARAPTFLEAILEVASSQSMSVGSAGFLKQVAFADGELLSDCNTFLRG